RSAWRFQCNGAVSAASRNREVVDVGAPFVNQVPEPRKPAGGFRADSVYANVFEAAAKHHAGADGVVARRHDQQGLQTALLGYPRRLLGLALGPVRVGHEADDLEVVLALADL